MNSFIGKLALIGNPASSCFWHGSTEGDAFPRSKELAGLGAPKTRPTAPAFWSASPIGSFRKTWRFILLACALTSCTTVQKPISSSLLDITGESRVTKLKSGLFRTTLFEQHEAFSVNGLLHMVDVGQEFHFPGKGDPTSAIGIAVAQSYKLIGESEVPTARELEKVRVNLEEVQSLILRLAILGEDLKRLRTELRNLSLSRQTSDSMTNLVLSISGEISTLLTEQAANRAKFLVAQERFRQAASKPVIIIARWRAANSAGASAKAGSSGSLSFGADRAQSGFVILGGVRFVTIVYGEDLWWLLNNLRPHEKKYVRDFGIVTYLIQARNVAYASEMDLSRVLSASAKVSRANVSLPASVEIEAAVEQLAQFGNSGNLGQISWKREPFCFVCGIDLPELTTNKRDKVIQRFLGAQDRWPDQPATAAAKLGPSYQGWRTIVAKVAHVGWFPANWPPFGKRVWEHYKDQRPMHGAPTCPICGGQTNAVIPGFQEPRVEELGPHGPLRPDCGESDEPDKYGGSKERL